MKKGELSPSGRFFSEQMFPKKGEENI